MMEDRMTTRRAFLGDAIRATGATVLSSTLVRSASAATDPPLHVACNAYSWSVFYRREGRDFHQALDEGLAAVAASGIDGFEFGLDQIDDMAPLLAGGTPSFEIILASELNSSLCGWEPSNRLVGQVVCLLARGSVFDDFSLHASPSLLFDDLRRKLLGGDAYLPVKQQQARCGTIVGGRPFMPVGKVWLWHVSRWVWRSSC